MTLAAIPRKCRNLALARRISLSMPPVRLLLQYLVSISVGSFIAQPPIGAVKMQNAPAMVQAISVPKGHGGMSLIQDAGINGIFHE